jgi:hypothetical protein
MDPALVGFEHYFVFDSFWWEMYGGVYLKVCVVLVEI